MKYYQNSQDGGILLSGHLLHVLLRRANKVVVWSVASAPRRIYKKCWHTISLSPGTVPEDLEKLLESPGGSDDFMRLRNWLAANQKIVDDIYFAGHLACLNWSKNQHLNQHLKKIN